MKIVIGADHGGYILKNQIVEHLQVLDARGRAWENADSGGWRQYLILGEQGVPKDAILRAWKAEF